MLPSQEETENLQQQLSQGLPSLDLHPDEAAHMRPFGPTRQLFFAGGRLALRRALQAVEAPGHENPVLPGEFGAPVVPDGVVGSISHTHGLAAAVVRRLSPGAPYTTVGVDVELASRRTSDRLARRILSAEEQEHLGLEQGLSAQADLTLRFSLKEAIYKAIHPLLQRPIPWHAVRVRPRGDGRCEVQVLGLEHDGMPLSADARWVQRGEYFVTTATVRAEHIIVRSQK